MIDLRILGSIELSGSQGRAVLAKGRERALLARLAIAGRATVSVDALVDDLWRGDPPPTAVKSLHGHVSRLRRALEEAEPGAAALLVTSTSGYALDLPDDATDRGRFTSGLARARAAWAQGDSRTAAAALERALAMWRGRPLADAAYEPFAQAEIAHLEELRAQAIELHADALLALSRNDEAVASLEPLTKEQPLRERPRGQLMLALYRAGRQSEALAVYRDTRMRLVEAVGIEPGPDLQSLERRVLAQDPSLLAGRAQELQPSRPQTEYARSGSIGVAYQLLGEGPRDLVWIRGHLSDLETLWEQPRFVSYVRRLAARTRVVLVEKRGTGMSDRPASLPNLDERIDDVRAVMDAAGARRATLHASYEGCRLAVLFAATYPERVDGLVLVDPSARGTRSPEYPWAPSDEEWRGTIDEVEREWGNDVYLESLIRAANPKASRDPEIRGWFVRLMRRSASPGAAGQFHRMLRDGDVTSVLRSVHVPTLVLHQPRRAAEAAYVAERIEGARLVELPAEDGVYWLDDSCVDAWVDETLAFVAGLDEHQDSRRELVVVVAADGIAGDGEARRIVGMHDGQVAESSGSRMVASFASAARAVAAADHLVRGPAAKAAVHAGDTELVDGRPAGSVVNEALELLHVAEAGVVERTAIVDALVGSTSPSRGE